MTSTFHRARRGRGRRRFPSLFAAAAAAALGLTTGVQADLYWDIDGSVPGGSTGTTANGTWDASNVWGNANGDATTGAWTSGEVAVFSAGTDVTGASVITLAGPQTASGIRFEEGDVTFSGAGLTLSGAAPSLVFGSGSSGLTTNLNSALSAANQVSFTRNSTATSTVKLGAANTFSGGLLVGEQIRVDANATGALGNGTVTVTGINSTFNYDVASSSTTFTNNFLLNPMNIAGVLTGFSAAGSNASHATFSGNISGNADVMITAGAHVTSGATNGNGLTVFSGTNTYTGKTIINMAGAGTLRLASTGALPAGTALEFGRSNNTQNIGLLDLFGQDVSISSLATITPTLTGSGIGITNSKSNVADQSTITVTGSATTTFAAVIGARTSTSLTNVGGAGTNAGTTNLSLTLAPTHTGKLTLGAQNTYVGDTIINGGTLIAGLKHATNNTIAGNVIVNSGGTFGSTATIKGDKYGVGGSVTVNSGATLAPGISSTSLIGTSTLRAASLTVNGGATIDMTMFSAANHDLVELSGALTLGSGTKTINVTLVGDQFAATPTNPIVLMTYPSMTGDMFTLGTNPDPGGVDFVYNLVTEPTRAILTAMPTVTTLAWDADAGGAPIAEGAGTGPWTDGGLNFTNIVDNTQAPWNNANNFNTIIGVTAGGAGGVIDVVGNIRAGGKITFGNVATPYTIGNVGETDTLTFAGGITNNAVGTIINTPVVIEASQNFNITDGAGNNSLTFAGAITQASSGLVITKIGGGNLTFNGDLTIGGLTVNGGGPTAVNGATNSIDAIAVSNGTLTIGGANTVSTASVTGGTLAVTTGTALGSAAVTISNNAVLRANANLTLSNAISIDATGGTISSQGTSDATFAGDISGSGPVTKAGSGILTLTGNNTFSGGLTIGGSSASTLVAGTDGALGSGSITIGNGFTFKALNSFATDNNIVLGGATSNVHTAGNTLTLSGVISGASGNNLAYRGGGRLVLSGANVQGGNVQVEEAGTLVTNNLVALGPGRDLIINAATTLEAVSDLNMRDVTGSGTMTLTKTGASTVTLRRFRNISALTISEGKIISAPSGLNEAVSKGVSTVSIASGAQLDLTNNKLIVVGMPVGTAPAGDYDGVSGLVQDGYANGAWTGSGIVTSMTDATVGDITTLAVASAADVEGISGTQTSSFGGQSVNPTDTLVMYTYAGDANLSGNVDADDYFQIDSNYNKSTSVFGYFNGDFNYDGVIDGDDFAIIDAGFSGQGAQISTAASVEGVTAVPEPGMGVIIAVGMLSACRRRVRRR